MSRIKLEKPLFDVEKMTLLWEKGEEEDVSSLSETIPSSDISKFSQAAHKRDSEAYDFSQTALCFEVIGGILVVIGILFVFLSLKKRMNAIVGVDFLSLQFFICCACLLAGVVLVSVGTTFLCKALRKRKEAQRDIAYLSSLRQNGERLEKM